MLPQLGGAETDKGTDDTTAASSDDGRVNAAVTDADDVDDPDADDPELVAVAPSNPWHPANAGVLTPMVEVSLRQSLLCNSILNSIIDTTTAHSTLQRGRHWRWGDLSGMERAVAQLAG